MPEKTVYTVGDVARRFLCQSWEVRRIYERGILPEPPRAGRSRIIPAEDIPKVEAALREHGYIPAATAAVAQ